MKLLAEVEVLPNGVAYVRLEDYKHLLAHLLMADAVMRAIYDGQAPTEFIPIYSAWRNAHDMA